MYFIPKYILILGFTIVVDYVAGILIEQASGKKRKWLLGASIAANVGVLGFFKYFNFLNANLAAFAQLVGWNYPIGFLSIALPIGLSFHTFQAMSYTIEVYRGAQQAERNFEIYALYVMFYPQLVAGPIERPQNLLHQFRAHHLFNYERVVSGLKLMAFGLFKKMVVADRLAPLVNRIYAKPGTFAGPSLVLGTLCFGFQIYNDFSGYSDIAIGAARVMGFDLMLNFNSPYHAQSVAEFWRRWHISLSTWFRDYVYIPLGGSRVLRVRWGINILCVFLLSGLWHGASWTYVIWGGLHGAYLIISALSQKIRSRVSGALGLVRFPRMHLLARVLVTFALVNIAWIFFRAGSAGDALGILVRLGTGWSRLRSLAGLRSICIDVRSNPQELALAFAAVLLVELVGLLAALKPTAIRLSNRPWWQRWSVYYAAAYSIVFLSAGGNSQFIYFQF